MNAAEGHGDRGPPDHDLDVRHRSRHRAAREARPPGEPVPVPPRRDRPAEGPPDARQQEVSRWKRSSGLARTISKSGGRMMTLEYILIRDVNDTRNDAEGLAAIARRLRAKVNIIACSPVPGLEFARARSGRHEGVRPLARGAEGPRDRAPVQGHRHRRRLRPARRAHEERSGRNARDRGQEIPPATPFSKGGDLTPQPRLSKRGKGPRPQVAPPRGPGNRTKAGRFRWTRGWARPSRDGQERPEPEAGRIPERKKGLRSLHRARAAGSSASGSGFRGVRGPAAAPQA